MTSYVNQPNYGNPYGQRQESRPQVKRVEIGGFYSEDGKLKLDLFDRKANEIADSIVGVTRTQLRRIFDEVKRFEQRLAVETWDDVVPYVRMVKSKVSYQVARAIDKNRSTEGAYRNLSAFITEGISLAGSEKDFRVFLSLFEAVYGFSYEKLKD